MDYVKGRPLSYKSLTFSETREINQAVDRINKAGYIIPFDFLRSIIHSDGMFGRGLIFLDFAGYIERKHHPEEDIQKYQINILSELEQKYAA